MTFIEWHHTPRAELPNVSHARGQGPTRIASVMGDQRESVARHLFVGGNAFVLRMVNRFRSELGVAASSQELEATARATLKQLETDTARLSIERVERAGNVPTVEVAVRNLAGHKLPSGYPSRRAWLHLVVRDRQGRVAFSLGLSIAPE